MNSPGKDTYADAVSNESVSATLSYTSYVEQQNAAARSCASVAPGRILSTLLPPTSSVFAAFAHYNRLESSAIESDTLGAAVISSASQYAVSWTCSESLQSSLSSSFKSDSFCYSKSSSELSSSATLGSACTKSPSFTTSWLTVGKSFPSHLLLSSAVESGAPSANSLDGATDPVCSVDSDDSLIEVEEAPASAVRSGRRGEAVSRGNGLFGIDAVLSIAKKIRDRDAIEIGEAPVESRRWAVGGKSTKRTATVLGSRGGIVRESEQILTTSKRQKVSGGASEEAGHAELSGSSGSDGISYRAARSPANHTGRRHKHRRREERSSSSDIIREEVSASDDGTKKKRYRRRSCTEKNPKHRRRRQNRRDRKHSRREALYSSRDSSRRKHSVESPLPEVTRRGSDTESSGSEVDKKTGTQDSLNSLLKTSQLMNADYGIFVLDDIGSSAANVRDLQENNESDELTHLPGTRMPSGARYFSKHCFPSPKQNALRNTLLSVSAPSLPLGSSDTPLAAFMPLTTHTHRSTTDTPAASASEQPLSRHNTDMNSHTRISADAIELEEQTMQTECRTQPFNVGKWIFLTRNVPVLAIRYLRAVDGVEKSKTIEETKNITSWFLRNLPRKRTRGQQIYILMRQDSLLSEALKHNPSSPLLHAEMLRVRTRLQDRKAAFDEWSGTMCKLGLTGTGCGIANTWSKTGSEVGDAAAIRTLCGEYLQLHLTSFESYDSRSFRRVAGGIFRSLQQAEVYCSEDTLQAIDECIVYDCTQRDINATHRTHNHRNNLRATNITDYASDKSFLGYESDVAGRSWTIGTGTGPGQRVPEAGSGTGSTPVRTMLERTVINCSIDATVQGAMLEALLSGKEEVAVALLQVLVYANAFPLHILLSQQTSLGVKKPICTQTTAGSVTSSSIRADVAERHTLSNFGHGNDCDTVRGRTSSEEAFRESDPVKDAVQSLWQDGGCCIGSCGGAAYVLHSLALTAALAAPVRVPGEVVQQSGSLEPSVSESAVDDIAMELAGILRICEDIETCFSSTANTAQVSGVRADGSNDNTSAMLPLHVNRMEAVVREERDLAGDKWKRIVGDDMHSKDATLTGEGSERSNEDAQVRFGDVDNFATRISVCRRQTLYDIVLAVTDVLGGGPAITRYSSNSPTYNQLAASLLSPSLDDAVYQGVRNRYLEHYQDWGELNFAAHNNGEESPGIAVEEPSPSSRPKSVPSENSRYPSCGLQLPMQLWHFDYVYDAPELSMPFTVTQIINSTVGRKLHAVAAKQPGASTTSKSAPVMIQPLDMGVQRASGGWRNGMQRWCCMVAAHAMLLYPREVLLPYMVMVYCSSTKICKAVLRVYEAEPFLWLTYGALLYQRGQTIQGRTTLSKCVARSFRNDSRLVASWIYLELVYNTALVSALTVPPTGPRPPPLESLLLRLFEPEQHVAPMAFCVRLCCFLGGHGTLADQSTTHERDGRAGTCKLLARKACGALRNKLGESDTEDANGFPICTSSFFGFLFSACVISAWTDGTAQAWDLFASHLPGPPKPSGVYPYNETSRSLELAFCLMLALLLSHDDVRPHSTMTVAERRHGHLVLLRDFLETALQYFPYNKCLMGAFSQLLIKTHRQFLLRSYFGNCILGGASAGTGQPGSRPRVDRMDISQRASKLASPLLRSLFRGSRDKFSQICDADYSDQWFTGNNPVTAVKEAILAELCTGSASLSRMTDWLEACLDSCEDFSLCGRTAPGIWMLYLQLLRAARIYGFALFDSLPGSLPRDKGTRRNDDDWIDYDTVYKEYLDDCRRTRYRSRDEWNREEDNDWAAPVRNEYSKVSTRAITRCPYVKGLWLHRLAVLCWNYSNVEEHSVCGHTRSHQGLSDVDSEVLDCVEQLMDKQIILRGDPLRALV
eukprot:GHVQ01025216.1.p1 GENE.GHVQ01025216.1~~GHVQ01025216.1.p1  ORF type:complete len:1885 (+),score=220.13 GHVQ01025216.1:154-5808(+)